MEPCGKTVVNGPPGGVRLVHGCPAYADDAVGGVAMCRRHADEARYQRRMFTEMMARATKHWRGVSIHGRGTWCGCGAFVPDGEAHPWGVPSTTPREGAA